MIRWIFSHRDDNEFKKFQRREGRFVLFPNAILSIALFITVLVIHGTLTESKDFAIIISFIIYSIIFHLIYSVKGLLIGGKTANNLFTKLNYEKLTGRIIFMNELHKIYLTFFVMFLLSVGTVFLITQVMLEQQDKIQEGNVQLQEFWFGAIQIILIPAIGAMNILLFRIFYTYVDFHYFLSLGCFKIIQKYQDMWDLVTPYFIKLGLESYDRYLRQVMKYGIRNKDQICTKMVLQSKLDLNQFINKLTNSFSGDELDPLRKIAKFLGEPESNHILISDNVAHKVKEATLIILTLLATLFVILTFLAQVNVISIPTT